MPNSHSLKMNSAPKVSPGDYPVGIFDSGIGGISVLHEIQAMMPQENYVYVADSAYTPYGDQSEEFIRERVDAIAKFLIKKPVKAIVVACNTATSAAVAMLREQYSLPIIGVEPAVKPAVSFSKAKNIGVLATQHTLQSEKYKRLKSQFSGMVNITDVACCGIADFIEHGKQDEPEFKALLKSYLKQLEEQEVDTVVLGCTHYPFAKEAMQKIMPADISFVDSGEAIAKELHRRLDANGILRSGVLSRGADRGSVSFYSTQKDDQTLSRLWGSPVSAEAIKI